MRVSRNKTYQSIVQLLAVTTAITSTTVHASRLWGDEAAQDQNPLLAINDQPEQEQKHHHPVNLHLPATTMQSTSSSGGGGPLKTMENTQVLLSDVLGRDRSINIFASYARDAADVSRRLDSEGGEESNSTVLAPLNSAVEGLPRKPWEDVNDGEEGDERERAQRNLRRFVEAHVVPRSPWGEGEKVGSLLDGGDAGEVWWEWKEQGEGEEKERIRVIQPDGIEVVGVASRVGNGEVWILRGVRNYAA